MNEIRPAFDVEVQSNVEMSSEDFQRQLFEFFEQKGIVSELRAHLRTQMIGILRSADVGKSFYRQTTSPKIQTIILLIAEFLLHEDYHYSLCVLSTEVPLSNIFPDFSSSLKRNNSDKNVNELKNWRFKPKDVLDILESFGIARESDEINNIFNMYYGNKDETLLTCIVRMLPMFKSVKHGNKTTGDFANMQNLENNEISFEFITDFISKLPIDNNLVCEVLKITEMYVNTVKTKTQKYYEEEMANAKKKIEDECLKKIEKYKRRVTEVEQIFEIERKKLEDELHYTKSSLKECAETLHIRFEVLDKQEIKLKAKEKELKQLEETLKKQVNNSIDKENEKLIDDNYLARLQKDCDCFRNELKQTCQVFSQSLTKKPNFGVNKEQQTCNEFSEVESDLLRQLVKQLQTENELLRNQNKEQQVKVQQLASNASFLVRDLGSRSFEQQQSCSSFIQNLHPGFQLRSDLTLEPPGEELRVFSPRNFRQIKESRKKLWTRNQSSSTSSSDEANITEDVLREAKERLKNLERESEQIEKTFRMYSRKNKSSDMSGFQSYKAYDFLPNFQDVVVMSCCTSSEDEVGRFSSYFKTKVNKETETENIKENKDEVGESSGFLQEIGVSFSTIDLSSNHDTSVQKNEDEG